MASSSQFDQECQGGHGDHRCSGLQGWHLVRLSAPPDHGASTPMTVTNYTQWVADGKPWKNCQPINDFIAMLRRHGYTGPGNGIGDQSHRSPIPLPGPV